MASASTSSDVIMTSHEVTGVLFSATQIPVTVFDLDRSRYENLTLEDFRLWSTNALKAFLKK